MATFLTRRYFPGKDRAWLEAALADCLEELKLGKVTDAYAAGDTNFHKSVDRNLSAERRRDMLLHDLSLIDPETYPPADVTPVKRTVPRYL